MALATGGLITALTTEFSPPPIPGKLMDDHADALAEAYNTYCLLATTSFGAPLVSGGKSSFKSTFLSVMTLPVPTIANYGLAIQSACIAYWVPAVFTVGASPPPGMAPELSIVVSPPLPVIAVVITAGLVVSLSASACATIIATAMDTGTRTVTTTHTGIVGIVPAVVGPVPIL